MEEGCPQRDKGLGTRQQPSRGVATLPWAVLTGLGCVLSCGVVRRTFLWTRDLDRPPIIPTEEGGRLQNSKVGKKPKFKVLTCRAQGQTGSL